MTIVVKSITRVWKSAQLYIGFYRDPKGNQRSEAKVWPPKNGNASIHPNTKEQETFLVVVEKVNWPRRCGVFFCTVLG